MLGLWTGVWINRLPKKRILMGWDFAAALPIGIIPIAAFLYRLSIGLIYVVLVLMGRLSAFGAAWHGFLAEVVPASS
jgi:hypothetical protein